MIFESINLWTEANYIKKLFFKDKNLFIGVGFIITKRYQCLKDKENLLEIRKAILGGFVEYSRIFCGEKRRAEVLMKKLEKDFYENTLKDGKYSKIIENMVIGKI